jgi:FlaA1/EpsC-like NDP-sugar epimerase
MDILRLIGREQELFTADVNKYSRELNELVRANSFLVIGGAGSIGQAAVKEIFKRQPKRLHVVDISENNLVELVRDLRSSLGYIQGEFATYALDCGSEEFDAYIASQSRFDYVLNLSALKHVRSEKDPYTLMRMIDVNIVNTEKIINQVKKEKTKKYFCVSTDKAANPANMMGASKRIMEMFLTRQSLEIPVSTARFANVAFSDGSLLYGFDLRMKKNQPLSAPQDIKRCFMLPQEAGELCLMSCLLGENRDIFFPKLTENINFITFSEIAVRYLAERGYEPYVCGSEEEARRRILELSQSGKWPCYFFSSDTTGEKDCEEFFTETEVLDMKRFEKIGVILNKPIFNNDLLEYFLDTLKQMKQAGEWEKEDIVELFKQMVPNFTHREKGKNLDSRM